jgi:hypothetical protein
MPCANQIVLAVTDRFGVARACEEARQRCQPEKQSKEKKGITSNSQSVLK